MEVEIRVQFLFLSLSFPPRETSQQSLTSPYTGERRPRVTLHLLPFVSPDGCEDGGATLLTGHVPSTFLNPNLTPTVKFNLRWPSNIWFSFSIGLYNSSVLTFKLIFTKFCLFLSFYFGKGQAWGRPSRMSCLVERGRGPLRQIGPLLRRGKHEEGLDDPDWILVSKTFLFSVSVNLQWGEWTDGVRTTPFYFCPTWGRVYFSVLFYKSLRRVFCTRVCVVSFCFVVSGLAISPPVEFRPPRDRNEGF